LQLGAAEVAVAVRSAGVLPALLTLTLRSRSTLLGGNLLSHSSVLIVSDDTEFARTVAARWQAERRVPEITLTTSDVWQASTAPGYNLVIVGPVRNNNISAILSALNATATTATIHISSAAEARDAQQLAAEHPHVLIIPREDGWIGTLILVAGEALRRAAATTRAQRAERASAEQQRHAALGRYMLDMRPSVNNALTSVLGNADLLLQDAASIHPDAREQIRTIHTMALRLNEILQRFSSVAAEMRAGEKESQAETNHVSQISPAGLAR
jgi:signal transduction histidine kinase